MTPGQSILRLDHLRSWMGPFESPDCFCCKKSTICVCSLQMQTHIHKLIVEALASHCLILIIAVTATTAALVP
jgi:hypothetical protein